MVPRMRPAHYERVLRETSPSGGLQHLQDGPGAQSLHQTTQKLSQILQVQVQVLILLRLLMWQI